MSRALQILPGGVDSPVRAFKAVGGSPLFIRRASGARIEDVDGNTFVDYVMSWGPLIHGHAPRGLVKALAAAARDGTSFGAPSPLEIELGERVRKLMPSIERVRFVNSGTEATMSAIRVARAATGRERIVKFEGCYHGHADPFLVKAGSGALTLGVPTSPGVTRAAVADTLVAGYNDLGSVQRLFDAHRGQIAAVIVEPIAGNMGVVPPADGFLRALRGVCTAGKALLIFDEVISGFRAAPGGAQQLAGRRARFDVPRQDHRRRTAGGRLRRPRRLDGARVSRRSRLSGRDAERQSAGHDRGLVESGSAEGQHVRVSGKARRLVWARGSRGRRAKPEWHSRSMWSVPC